MHDEMKRVKKDKDGREIVNLWRENIMDWFSPVSFFYSETIRVEESILMRKWYKVLCSLYATLVSSLSLENTPR